MNAKRVSLCVVPILLCANLAVADQVALSSGSGGFYIGGDLSSFELNGLDTQLQENSRLGGWDPMEFAAGDSVSLNIKINASPVPNQPITQVVNGTTYHDVFLQGTLSIIGEPFIAPAGVEEERRTFSVSMTLTGQLSGFSNFQGTGTPVFSVSVFGTGRVFADRYMFLTTGDGQAWRLLPGSTGSFKLTTDTSAPVPEPATMMLLATGLAGAGWRSRRLRTRKDAR